MALRSGSDTERFLRAVSFTPSGCWQWGITTIYSGYGQFKAGGKNHFAHRWIYERTIGKVPQGLELDHNCRNRSCVNPWHLEPVTHQENGFRARKSNCIAGHPLLGENLYVVPSTGQRQCRECVNRRGREYYLRKKVRHAVP